MYNPDWGDPHTDLDAVFSVSVHYAFLVSILFPIINLDPLRKGVLLAVGEF
jgi:hypothetical protein